jgi:hypothetical protein
VLARDPPGDGQAEAGAFAGAGRVGLVEAFEDLLAVG